jgi:hypothetical protein
MSWDGAIGIVTGCRLGISRRLVQHILKSDLNLYPCRMTVLPKLTVQNKYQRMAFAEWAQNNEVLFNNVWLSEAQFHFGGKVNKQNVQILGIRESTCDSSEGASCTENYSGSQSHVIDC